MTRTVAVFAMGEMGAGVSRRLVDGGARVITLLEGRSAQSVERARSAGVAAVNGEAELVGQADIFLSILPPSEASNLARRMFAAMRSAGSRMAYVDCNAVAVTTVQTLAAPFLQAGIPFVDASIVGPPPKPGNKGPRFYASGPDVAALETLRHYGLDVRPVGSGIGDASALKMSYAGITKGFQALGAAMVLGAEQGGVADAFWAELRGSQPVLLEWLTRELPRMYPKAYRWIGEMEEIATFLQSEPGSAAMLAGAARLYEAVAADNAAGADTPRIKALTAFVDRGKGKD